MAIFVFFANIVNGISAKNALNAVIWPNETYVSTKANFISSSTILIIPGILAILVPSVLSVFTILGGYLSISVAILFPGTFYPIFKDWVTSILTKILIAKFIP